MAFSSDEKINSDYKALCTAMGHLFFLWGRFETTFSALLKLHLARNMGDEISEEAVKLSAALYGSMRFAAMRDTYRRLVYAEGESDEVKVHLDGFFAHIGAIGKLRDHLAHKTVVPAHEDFDAEYQIMDALNIRNLEDVNVWTFDRDALTHAAFDLDLAADRLGNRQTFAKLVNHPEFDVSTPPWRYKQSMLKRVDPKKLRSPLGHKLIKGIPFLLVR